MDLIYREGTEGLISEFFPVQNEVGLGRQQEDYHQAYDIWVAEQSLPIGGREAIVLYPAFRRLGSNRS